MSDTLGYGFISPNYIDNLTKELAEAKAENARLKELLIGCLKMQVMLDAELCEPMPDSQDPTGERNEHRDSWRGWNMELMGKVRKAVPFG